MASDSPVLVFVGPEEGWAAVSNAISSAAQLVHVESTQQALAAALTNADGLIDAAIRIPLTDEMVRAAPRLKVVSCASTGADHVARAEIDRRGIVVRTLRDSPDVIRGLTPAAELSWALVMACARKLPAAIAHVRAGGWAREQFPGVLLRGRQLGLIGCGRIGGWMARYAEAFGMRVVGYDPHQADWPTNIVRISIEQLMKTSDVVSVHVPLNEETKGLVSAALFACVKPGAIFINTSRGSIADEAALLAGLNSGRIGAAGLDVLDGEPAISNHPLLAYARDHDNLLITPHCGGNSPDAIAIVSAHAARVAFEEIKRQGRS
ncbi:MAG TPA: NAD(P)-dependent oxidoreductase [Xanthobacteraceae bacterium]|nr:NAD(P)-dependent oxidoreductase [Xanthobacteraceae bacterium]